MCVNLLGTISYPLCKKKGYGLVSARSQPYRTRPEAKCDMAGCDTVCDTAQYNKEIDQSTASIRVELMIICNITLCVCISPKAVSMPSYSLQFKFLDKCLTM